MLDAAYIRNNPDEVKRGIASKNVDPSLVDEFLRRDTRWRELSTEVDAMRARQKKLGKERNVEEAKKLKEELRLKEETLYAEEKLREEVLRQLPNPAFSYVPLGKSDKENVVLRDVGEKPKFDFLPKDYLTLAEALDLIDVARGAKVSGARFSYIKREAALLEFALVRFVFDSLLPHGFIPVVPPVMVKEEMMRGMGYVDRGEDRDETYFLEKDGLYLVGTSEQSIGPMCADEIFTEEELPKRYVAFSTCFRREAGSYGKDTKGILRVHQFDKLEMLSFCHPDRSQEEHKFLLSMEEQMMQALGVPYHVLDICTGDLGTPVAAKFDIEAWMPGQNDGKGEYRETHSTSNTTDFQSRRLNVRFRPRPGSEGNKKPEYVHLLNGTAFAIGRIMIAIFENYQRKDGTIAIPKVLQPYMGGITEIKR